MTGFEKIAIFGCGQFGKVFYEALEGKIDFFIDDFFNNTVVNDKIVLNPESACKNTKVFISVFENSISIKLKLKKMGFKEVLSFGESVKAIPNILHILAQQEYLWLTNNKSKMVDIVALQKVKKLLKDNKSIYLMDKIINFRMTFDPAYYPDPEGLEYFPEDVPVLQNLDTVNFVDCGAYIGDTATSILDVKKVENMMLFEPNKNNFQRLKNVIKTLKVNNTYTNFFLYPCGVFSNTECVGFSNEKISSSSHIEKDKKTENIVPVCSLDDILIGCDINFIKMDIEGAEKEAIKGATRIIQNYKPNLAICLYHKPEDLWELPLLIHEIEPSYDIYLRVHSDLCLSTIMYCICKDNKN